MQLKITDDRLSNLIEKTKTPLTTASLTLAQSCPLPKQIFINASNFFSDNIFTNVLKCSCDLTWSGNNPKEK